MNRLQKWGLRLAYGLVVLAPIAAVANYAVTLGAGTNFGSVVVSTVHYAQMMICDLTTPAQCASVSAGGAVKVDGSAVTQPVSAATLPLPAGASTAAKQPALGTAGAASADVLTIQGTASMTKLLVTPDSVALPANQSVNVSQINGVTPLMGNGVTGTGSPRVTIASDNTAFAVNATLQTGANTIGALTANQSVNTAQVNGVTTSTGTGAVGTGSQRVAIGTDTATIAGSAPTTQLVIDTIVTPSGNFTRPANTTAYASGQLVANSTTAGSVVPLSWTAARVNNGNFYIRRVKVTLSSKSVTNTSFRVHFYTTSPTIANGDGAAWSTTIATWVCDMDVTIDLVGTDVSAGIGLPRTGHGNECNIVAGGGAQLVYGLVEARAAYTPASAEVVTVVPEIHQN